MKHILKKFLTKVQLGTQAVKVLDNSLPLESLENIDLEEHLIFGTTEKNEMIAMFTLSKGKERYIIPEPDLIVCLFECGRQYAVQMPKLQNILLSKAYSTTKSMVNSYNFYASSCLAITSLVNAIEAFMNRQIPNSFEYVYQEPQRKIIQNKEQIERNISFEKKIKDVIPAALGKNFHMLHPDRYTILYELKTLRDEMTHIKSHNSSNIPISYEKLYNKAFKFDYLQALDTVKFYINFYHTDLIEPCSCGKDF